MNARCLGAPIAMPGFVCLGVMLLALAPTACAQSLLGEQRVVSRLTGDDLKDILSSEGYTQITIDEDDDVILKIDGTGVIFLTADDHRSIQCRVGWSDTDATLEGVNDWNRSKRYSNAYIDEEGDPILELDLDLDGGVTVSRIKNFIGTAKVSIAAFYREVL